MSTYTLLGGGYQADVTDVGAAVHGLRFDGRELIPGWAPEGPPPFFNGAVLAPWPNRVVGARYVFADECFELPVNEPERGHALHGFVAAVPWTCAEFACVEDDHAFARFTHTLEPQPGYPFRLRLETRHDLSAAGLTTTVTAENIGENAAPYGTGPHPWLLAGPDVREYELDLPAAKVLLVDELLAPRALEDVTYTPYDYRQARRIGDTAIDHAFTALAEGQVRVRGPEGGLEMSWDATVLPWVQICTGTGLDYHGLAVEPMTCPPDAFNSGTDLIVLKPGDTHRAAWTLAAL
ncbi:aldose 1-epimerase family protein [Acrocarpospora catenulata]|uniref:aldose 1-epimerase family protein n=1 Tax=Acrocarpospora catenulata TaxID=2836182 RepID=UPI001BDB0227|nr:aldose 1-epimerase family protein [Acrocarpospora catenulata]